MVRIARRYVSFQLSTQVLISLQRLSEKQHNIHKPSHATVAFQENKQPAHISSLHAWEEEEEEDHLCWHIYAARCQVSLAVLAVIQIQRAQKEK